MRKTAPRRLVGRLVRGEKGASAIEFALVFPALVLLLFGIIEFGRFMWTDNSLRHAVQEGARCAALNCCSAPGATCTSPEQLAASRADGLQLSAADFLLVTQDCGKHLSAGADGGGIAYQFILGDLLGLAGVTLTLQAEACYPTLDR